MEKYERKYLSWQIAHQVVEIAEREGKAIVVENLERIPKGRRGDGMPKLRQKLQKLLFYTRDSGKSEPATQ